MRTVIDIAKQHAPGADVRAKERSGETVPTYDVWAREPGAKRGKRTMVIRFPTLSMDAPAVERL